MTNVTKLFLTNTLTKKKEEFKPDINKEIKIYGCGVTPYDYSHIGHGRSYVFIDILVRFLMALGFKVKYVRNITDIDDKLIDKALKEGDINKYKLIAEKFTRLYQDEMKALNCLTPDVEPKVTDHIDKIIDFIRSLIKSGNAYVIDNDVYFDVSTYKKYGKLSGKKLDDLISGARVAVARVAVDKRKRNPQDFALWKGNNENLFWKTEWGYGRPGWHIECSVLAKEYLGESIDIHCGGIDLIFPHHENEIAQSESLHGKTFAKFWVHNGLLKIDKEKMSKSLGNILSLKNIFEKYDPMVLRYYFLQHYYRMPVDFSFEMLDSAQVAYKKLVNIFSSNNNINSNYNSCLQRKDVLELPVIRDIISSLSDDINTPKMLGILFENLSTICSDSRLLSCVRTILKNVLGLSLEIKEHEIKITPEIEDLIKKREAARKEKRWEEADKIRDKLRELGYNVVDKVIGKKD